MSFYLLFYLLFFFWEKKNKIYLKIIKNYKKRKIENLKNEKFPLSLYCVCPVARTVWHLLSKNTKNSFFSLLVSVRPFASCDTYFQVIQKYQKYKIFKSTKKISTFSNKQAFLKNYVTLISHFEWEYVGPRSILVGPKKIKKYLRFFF